MPMEQTKRSRENEEDEGSPSLTAQNGTGSSQKRPRLASPTLSSARRIPILPQPPQREGPQAVTRVRKGFHEIKSLYSAVRSIRKNEYRHKPLAQDSFEIRLLTLHAGKWADTIHCSFRVVPLAEAHGGYEALSYYWGDDEPSEEIWIRELKGGRDMKAVIASSKPKRFYIRFNLLSALQRFREEDRDIILWVDALFIDQDNEEEKNQQVQKMSQIYSTAHHVLVWLGAGELKCAEAIDFLKKVVNLAAFDKLASDKMSGAKWDALVELMHCRWFSRRWVVQELALARDATLHYGEKTINWRDFADAVAAFVTKYDDIKRLSSPLRQSGQEADFEGFGAYILVDVTNNLFGSRTQLRTTPVESWFEHERDVDRSRLLSLEALVAMLLSFEASDPRDTIYALLSIAKYKNYNLEPDYSKTVIEVYRDFVQYCVKTSGSIDIICRHWAPIEKPPSAALQPIRLPTRQRRGKPIIKAQMPSWVALLTKSRFGDPEQALNGRVNADSLVGHPDRKFYDACGGHTATNVRFDNIDLEINRARMPGKPPYLFSSGCGRKAFICSYSTYDIETEPAISHHASDGCSSASQTEQKPQTHTLPVNAFFMHVEGFEVDRLDAVSARIADGLLLRECLVMGGWGNRTRFTLIEIYPMNFFGLLSLAKTRKEATLQGGTTGHAYSASPTALHRATSILPV